MSVMPTTAVGPVSQDPEVDAAVMSATSGAASMHQASSNPAPRTVSRRRTQ